MRQPQWILRLFGPLEIERPDATVSAPSGKKLGELLAWLALQSDKRMRREDLAVRCWPESDSERQRGRLRQEIAALRELLGTGEHSPLVVSKEHIQLRPESLRIDMDAFTLLLEEAHRSDSPAAKADRIDRALGLYRDDLLTEYPDLFSTQRSAYRRRYETALHELARIRGAMGDHAGAIHCLQRLLAHDPMLEEVHAELMCAYADLKQPSQIRRQYAELERILSQQLNTQPTEATRLLRNSLLEGMRHDEVRLASAEQSAAIAPIAILPQADLKGAEHDTTPQPVPPVPVRSLHAVYGWTVLLVVLCAIGLLFPRRRPRPVPQPTSALPLVRRNQATWAYVDRLQAGEKPNSEAFAATFADDGDLIVTGQVETQKEDTDFLTVKLSPDNKLRWRKRFSSAFHDCDRARSVAPDTRHGAFVAGESFCPAHSRLVAGWHATLVHYNDRGEEQWVRHTDLRIQSTEKLQVVPDYRGGAILVAPEESKPHQGILFFHYDAGGRLLRQWKYAPSRAAGIALARVCASAKGRLFVCGALRQETGNAIGAGSDWLTICYDNDGNLCWEKVCEGPVRGNHSPAAIGSDRNGDVFVGGVFSLGNSDDGSTTLCPALAKYSLDGQPQWLQWYAPLKGELQIHDLRVSNDGNSATLAGKILTPEQNFAGFALAFSGNGVLLQNHRDRLRAGFLSSIAMSAFLTDDNRLLMAESISPMPATRFLEDSEIALNWSDMEGADRALYCYSGQKSERGYMIPRATLNNGSGIFTCGRVPLTDHTNHFAVVSFPYFNN